MLRRHFHAFAKDVHHVILVQGERGVRGGERGGCESGLRVGEGQGVRVKRG